MSNFVIANIMLFAAIIIGVLAFGCAIARKIPGLRRRGEKPYTGPEKRERVDTEGNTEMGNKVTRR
jgi:hypothetical protein